MKTVFNWFGDDWKRVKNHCRTTDNKDFSDNEASETFKKIIVFKYKAKKNERKKQGHRQPFTAVKIEKIEL